jgi:protein disulfide-isomerase
MLIARLMGETKASWSPRRLAGRVLGLLATAACLVAVPAGGTEGWLTDYDVALEAAAESGRPVLTIFTGSDWCPHCTTLENNVLSTETFHAWARENVVLLMVDLPQNGISASVRSERSQVCIKYGVRTFPSALLIGADGEKITLKKGYTGQTAASWVAEMAAFVPARPAPDAATTANAGNTGVLRSLEDAVVSAQDTKRPILLVVSRKSDSTSKTRSASLINDPEFDAFARENFVVAEVPAETAGEGAADESMQALLGGAPLAEEAVEIIVTEDGQTPLFSQSGTQPPARVVSGLRRFLAARQAARGVNATRR